MYFLMIQRRFLAALCVVFATLAACIPHAVAQDQKISIVATTGMIADAARSIGGDLADVRALMGPGVDPHAYRQTRSDIVAMINADLVLWHGLYLEAQMEEFLLNLAEKKAVIAVAETLPETELRSHDIYRNKYDPHIWMDPELWSKAVSAIADALTMAIPEAGAQFEANSERYLAQLRKLTDYSKQITRTVPEEARILVTAHDAFNYFGDAYGFEVVGIQGISTESETGLNRITELVNMLVERNIGAVFVESSVSDRNIRALIEGANARGHEVVIGGELYSDAMGPDQTYEGTYIGMIDHNVTTITRSLGGEAPPRGMNGQLSPGS
jgi:manganese/zinc/iron transport system substrate-binding protein